MEDKINFTCIPDTFQQIPEELVKEKNIYFSKVHSNREDIAILSKALKEYRKDSICKVPFCVTVEAEAFGARVKLSNEKTGPLIAEYKINKIEELEQMEQMNLKSGRIREVLEAVEILSKGKEVICLNVTGPFTIATSLMEPMNFYKNMRKNKEAMEDFMEVIQKSIVSYIIEGIKRGAKIISYADPAGALDLVGPKMYKEGSGKITYDILKKVEPYLQNSRVHLCGKTSIDLEKSGFSTSRAIKYKEGFTYGEAICDIVKENTGVQFIGHSCMKRTPFKSKDCILWKITLRPEELIILADSGK